VPEEPQTLPGGFDWESAEDLTALPEPELGELLSRVLEQERQSGYRTGYPMAYTPVYRRELLRGRANLIRAELAGRGTAGLTSRELARVLLGEDLEDLEGGRT
jgi:hypothetical protein